MVILSLSTDFIVLRSFNFMKLFSDIITFAILLICGSVLIVSCETTQKAVSELQSAEIPCADSAISNENCFRESSYASSSNIGIAKEKALSTAKAKLANLIITNGNTKLSVLEIEKIVREKFMIICEKYEENKGRYSVYLAIEVQL